MIVYAAHSPSPVSRKVFKRSTLLVGVSLVVLAGLGSKADARSFGGGSGAGAASTPAAVAAAAAAASAQQSSAAGRQAIQSMARAAQSLQAIRDAQTAARDAALAATGGTVPNGLIAGGLVVAPGAGVTPDVWVGADKPTSAQVSGRTQVEIKQTEQKAILNWSSFNVGRETDVYFNQTAGGADKANWIALNRVTDPSLAPSRILGTIKAEGQVYVINKNGIVFGGASQVNVNSFVASSLSLSDEQFRAGINAQLFVFNDGSGNGVIAKPQFGYLGQGKPVDFYLGLHDPGQTPGVEIGAAPGDITIEAGAHVATASGGKALIFAPRVTNSGRIIAPDGQVIMAAGEQVYLATDVEGIRGLTVAVSAPMRWMFDYNVMMSASGQGNMTSGVQEPFMKGIRDEVMPEMAARAASVGYSVINNGMVSSDHGNITLMSRSIVQNGALEASTALNNREGSIRLRAWDQGMLSYGSSISGGSPLRYWSTGTLTLVSGSVTTAMPDLTDTSEIEQTSLGTRYRPGSIELRGKLINIEAAANVIVPAGKISIVASTLTEAGDTPITGETNLYDGSRVYIGEDAYLSVAGLQNVLLTMESNVVTGEFRINELRDSPLYRDSWLRGKTVSVDKRVSGLFGDGPMADVQWVEDSPGKWVGTPLGDFSGWIGVGKTTLGELSTTAGSIAIKSSGDIITRAGALFDVSGGSVRYQDGWITTTKVVGADGRIYDIGKAMPDQLYVGFAGSFSRTHNVQGKTDTRLTETWTSIFDRNVSRRFERGYTEGRDAGEIRLYAASAMVLDGSYWGGVVNGENQLTSGKLAARGKITIGGLGDEYGRWLIGNLIIADKPPLLPTGFTAADTLESQWATAPVLMDPIPDPNDPTHEIPRNPNVPGNWIEPVKTTYLDSGVLADSGLASFNLYVRNSFTLAKGEKLELAPATSFTVLVNSSAPTTTFTIDGSIRIAGGSVRLGGGKINHYGASASIDVSGEWRNGSLGSEPPVINGGSISVAGEFAPGFTLNVSGGGWYDTTNIKAKLKLGDAGSLTLSPTDIAQLADLDLRGYAAASGGSLSILTSGSVQIGGMRPADPATGWLAGSLFADRGFRGFTLTTTGDIVVSEGASIAQIPLSVDMAGVNLAMIASGARVSDVRPLIALALAERAAHKPTSLSLVGDHVLLDRGAVVRTDVGGSINLSAVGHPDETNTNVPGHVIIRGTIDAPAGSVALSAGGGELKLLSGAQVLARGVAVVDDTARGGLRSGMVLAGGAVSFSNALTMIIEKGALVDVSGASGTFDIDRGRNGSEPYTLTSGGGSISLELSGKAEDLIAGNFRAFSGGTGSNGGALNINVLGTLTEPTPEYTAPATIWYIDRVTGLPVSLNSRGNLDVYREYSSGTDTAFRYSAVVSAIRTASAGLIRGGGLAIVDLDADTTPGSVSQPLSSVMAGYAAQLDLLNKNFYTSSAVNTRIALPTANIKLTKISSDTVNNGGFGTLDVKSTAFVVAPGVSLSLGKAVTIASSINSGGPGTASISAPYILLNGSSAAPGAGGAGKIVLTADLIDVTRAAFGGFADTQLIANDLRLGGLLTDLAVNRSASLGADGRLELKVGQVYPGTGISAAIKAGSSLVIERNGDAALPLSAAGTLSLEAPAIVQNGVVRAPFGSITMTATDSITLGANSVTSVSGDGLILPYGALSNNEFWVDPTIKTADGVPTPTLSKLPEKNIVLQGPRVTLTAGSVVDIRGGGDLYGWEHVPGPGGSHDVLAPTSVYAIVPGMNVSAASQNKVWLAGGNGLSAGWYALLPARYALLPGAFAVSVVKGSASATGGISANLADGTTLMPGFRADAYGDGRDQVMSSWRVMSGAVLRSYSEYNEAFANTYFASEAFKLSQYRLNGVDIVTPRLPMDGGAVVFKATESLVLDGTLQSQPAAGGRGGLVDISGQRIAIVGAGQDRSDLAGYLVVDAASLTRFGAGSLLVGGVRSVDALGLRINVAASDVLVRNDAGSSLSGPEILLAASGLVRVDDGSVIVADGVSAGESVNLVMAPQVSANATAATPSRDYGALIRVSAGNAIKVLRENVDTTTGGVVAIGSGATLAGGGALLIDATGDTSVSRSARLSGKALSLASGRIGFGGGINGLVLDATSLALLANTQALTLRSYSTIDFYTSVNLGNAGLKAVTFDSAGIVGYGSGAISVTGDTVALENSAGTFVSPGVTGNVLLSLSANDIVLGGGAKTLRGFDAVTLTASHQITGQGTGSLDAGTAGVTLTSPVMTGRGGASQSITTQNAIRVVGSDAPVDNPEASLGSRFALTGSSIDFGGRLVALGGAVSFTATAGNITISAGGLIDVGGFKKQFFDIAQFADAGSIALTAAGSLIMSPGSHLNLSALAEGGSAGKLSLTASNGGTVSLSGQIDARASKDQTGGSFALDIAALPDFATLSQTLNVAGFAASRQFRIRNGNVVIDGVTEVADFSLTADQGSVVLAGTIDARSAFGGRIAVSAKTGLTMLGSALLQAGATGEFGSGRVTLEASGGDLDIRGGAIDVAGAEGGHVRFRALQKNAHSDVQVLNLHANIVGARSSVLEAVSIYDNTGGSVNAVRSDAIADANIFIGHAATIAARLNAGSIAIMPGIEISHTGDLTLETDWNLAADFGAARLGSLTLRAGGNLVILGNLSDGFTAADNSGVLQDTASWDLRLVAGADLTSASALSVTPIVALGAGTGSLTIGSSGAGTRVRTGTGDIDVAVGRDLMLAHSESAIYTAGRRDMTTFADFDTPAGAVYGIDGGHLRINAQGSASSALAANPRDNQLFVEWLKKTGYINAAGIFLDHQQSSWWVDFSAFQQGIGALGGGNISLRTGGDVSNMLVALAANGRMRGGRSEGEAMVLEMRNGGLLNVEAGGAIRGGQYYAARGAGNIVADAFDDGRTIAIVRNSLSGTSKTDIYSLAPVIAMGDATLTVRTAGDLRLQTVMDPLLLNGDSPYFTGGGDFYSAYMSGYTDRTSLNLTSIGGDIKIVGQGRFLSKDLTLTEVRLDQDYYYSVIGLLATNLYPSMTRISALNGSVATDDRLFTMPGRTPELRILADQDVVLSEVIMSRANPVTLPSPYRPVGGDGGSAEVKFYNVGFREDLQAAANSGFHNLLENFIEMQFYGALGTQQSFIEANRNPTSLVNADDMEPSRIFAKNGSISSTLFSDNQRARLSRLVSNEQTWLRAGTDIRNINYELRNLHRTDVSVLESGKDIIGGTIKMQGPGEILLAAGRDVYGSTFQVVSNGNYNTYVNNRAVETTEVKGLSRDSAAITVMAGLNGKQPAYDDLAAKYLDPYNLASMPDYLKLTEIDLVLPDTSKLTLKDIVVPRYWASLFDNRDGKAHQLSTGMLDFVYDMTGQAMPLQQAYARFRALPVMTQQRFLRQVYFQELKAAGDDQNTLDANGQPLHGGYQRGYNAIETLFPGTDWKGNIQVGSSTFRTMAGGRIETLTPGGGLQVAALGRKVDDGEGLVTIGSGDISIFARDSVKVNRSRVLTFAGGDEVIWSTFGDIDAGRGAKTARVPSEPEITTDEDGVTTVKERADISGSGIGTIIGFTGVEEGDVFLIAPRGTVNAGDAGIRVSGNFTVAAQFVLNADNIKVGGATKGMPKMENVSVNLNVETKDKAASDAVKDATESKGNERPSVIIVEVLGYGGGSSDDEAGQKDEKRRQPDDRRSYNTNSVIQLVGNGTLNQEQSEALTDDEKQRLQEIARAARSR